MNARMLDRNGRRRFVLAAITGVVFLSLLAGCAPQVLTPSPGDIQTALAQTLAAQPTATVGFTPEPTRTPQPTPTQYLTPTPTVSPPISGTVNSEFLNMREGPSTMFQIVKTYTIDTPITAVSRTLDSQWVKVEVPAEEADAEATVGWMWVPFLELSGDPSGLPLETFDPAQTVQGATQDLDGNPIAGINIAIVLSNDDYDLRTDTTTGDDGTFEVYLPVDLVGTLDVQVISWDCESIVVDLECQLSGYVEGIDRAFIAIPQSEEILFTYEKTDRTLTGVVQDNRETPVQNVSIVAEREDGFTSYGKSDALGEFSIPITAGNWEVYTITFTPTYTEGDHVSVEVGTTAPEEIILLEP